MDYHRRLEVQQQPQQPVAPQNQLPGPHAADEAAAPEAAPVDVDEPEEPDAPNAPDDPFNALDDALDDSKSETTASSST